MAFLTSSVTFGILLVYSTLTIRLMEADKTTGSATEISLSSPPIIETLILNDVPTLVVRLSYSGLLGNLSLRTKL